MRVAAVLTHCEGMASGARRGVTGRRRARTWGGWRIRGCCSCTALVAEPAVSCYVTTTVTPRR
jgi:hypothetical protein